MLCLKLLDKYGSHKQQYSACIYLLLFSFANVNWMKMKGVTSIVGAVVTNMGILTTPQLHWMVRARNKGLKASEQDYFEQLSSSLRLVQSILDVVMIDRGDSVLFLFLLLIVKSSLNTSFRIIV